MKKLGIVATAACLALVLSGCSGPKDKIIGKWERKDTQEIMGTKIDIKMVLDFQKDGKLKWTASSKAGEKTEEKSGEGTYKWVDNENIEVTMKDPESGKEKTEKNKVKVTDTELTITGKNELTGKEEDMKFTKVK